MIRPVLLTAGFIWLILQHAVQGFTPQLYFVIFFVGIVLLGIPHGAADLLVAQQNSNDRSAVFSKIRFLINYIGRLLLFSLIFWFFPVTANILFILFAAYHFGETDLSQFKTNTLPGKLFITSYGLVILSVILLQHFTEIKPMFLQFESGLKNKNFINWIEAHCKEIMLSSGILFSLSASLYFFFNRLSNKAQTVRIMVQFAFILFILYHMPMLSGFTFYFVVWHSLLSLSNIVSYLRKNNTYSFATILKQILFYSALALSGIALFGSSSLIFLNNNSVAGYLFLGLAVLTAPHMQVMHDMYISMRTHKNLIT